MSEEPKRFSEWVEVDCNECQRYWDNSCDGCKDALKGSKTPCNSFLATRSVIIPKEIERLKQAVSDLKSVQLIQFIILGAIVLMLSFKL